MKLNKEQEKTLFLKQLSFMNQEDLNRLIKEKGKKPKLFKPIIRL